MLEIILSTDKGNIQEKFRLLNIITEQNNNALLVNRIFCKITNK